MAAQHVDRQTFLANLRQSGLLSPAQLDALAPRLPDTPRGRVIARALVEQGVLTRFQAEQLLAGRTSGFFLDQYRILEELGQGGMSRVFKAEHRTLGRVVALKVLSPSVLRTDRAQELFLREVRAVALLVHPHIVTAFDANQANGRYYLVLEYVAGLNLDQYVREKGPLPVGLACDFIRQAALGLQYAHEKGMVHRDIKPANLLLQLDEQGRPGLVKVSDFGLARLTEPETPPHDRVGTILTKDNTVMGTPDYLSPEQARNLHNTDIRSDLYSLGCTFYFLLTGRVPFPGGTTMEKLIRHSANMATPIRALRPEVPAEVAAIVERLMAKDPAERLQTPAELITILAPWAAGAAEQWSGTRRVVRPPAELDDEPPENGSSSDSWLPAEDESAAQIATLTPDASPTPLSGGSVASARLSGLLRARQKRRQQLALFWTLGIVGAALTLAGVLTLVLSRF
jgi:serine/threonine protein kinase